MTSKLCSLAILVSMICVIPTSVAAAPILDQTFEDPPIGVSLPIDSSRRWAQTFTVGISGVLASVEVRVAKQQAPPPGDLILEIRPTVGGVPVEDDGLVLASVSVPSSSVPELPIYDYVSFDLNSFGVSIAAGDVLAITLHDPTAGSGDLDNTYTWNICNTTVIPFDDCTGYAAGQVYGRPIGDVWSSRPESDAAFRTFVVPEPSTGLLLASALGLLASRRRVGGHRAT